MESARRILELMFLTAWADGRFEGSEAFAIQKLAANVTLLREVRLTGDIDLATKRRLAEVGLETCVREAAAAITHQGQRELAYQCCAKVGGADGAFVAQEAQVLRLLRETWGFTDEDVERILVLATR
jgi:tellurite resistance protein